MRQFVEFNFDAALEIFNNAEISGSRWRVGDLPTALWLQKNDIHLEDVVTYSKKMPDVRIVIIGEGPWEGFYMYSPKLKTCFKFEHSLAEV